MPLPVHPSVAALVPVIAKAFAHGRVVPFLGAGASLIGRINAFTPGTNFPTGGELADHLATQSNYPADWEKSLTRVSQFMLTRLGSGPLYSDLHGVFAAALAPNSLHALLASLTLRQKTPPATVVITTNYDTLVEDALTAAGVPFDVLTYIARGKKRGLFRHTTSDGAIDTVIDERGYDGIPFNKILRRLERPLVLKIHGTVAENPDDDSYVITEEDYIEYLARTDVSILLPTQVAEILAQKHFLFLGYSLSDWNLRVLLSRVWQRQEDNSYRSWAANRTISQYDSDFWKQYDVDCHEIDLSHFTTALATAMNTELGLTPP
jgi:SIR2-like domain